MSSLANTADASHTVVLTEFNYRPGKEKGKIRISMSKPKAPGTKDSETKSSGTKKSRTQKLGTQTASQIFIDATVCETDNQPYFQLKPGPQSSGPSFCFIATSERGREPYCPEDPVCGEFLSKSEAKHGKGWKNFEPTLENDNRSIFKCATVSIAVERSALSEGSTAKGYDLQEYRDVDCAVEKLPEKEDYRIRFVDKSGTQHTLYASDTASGCRVTFAETLGGIPVWKDSIPNGYQITSGESGLTPLF